LRFCSRGTRSSQLLRELMQEPDACPRD
jgi:hypothetical protein